MRHSCHTQWHNVLAFVVNKQMQLSTSSFTISADASQCTLSSTHHIPPCHRLACRTSLKFRTTYGATITPLQLSRHLLATVDGPWVLRHHCQQRRLFQYAGESLECVAFLPQPFLLLIYRCGRECRDGTGACSRLQLCECHRSFSSISTDSLCMTRSLFSRP